MIPLVRTGAVALGFLAAFFLGSARQSLSTQSNNTTPSMGETFLVAVEYRTPTKNDQPIPSASENVVVYHVPTDKRVRVSSYLLPLGLPEDGGGAIAPLGLGVLANDRTALPRTVAFGNAYDLVRVEPGIVFEPNQKIVVRFSKTVKAFTGSLFLNGTIVDDKKD
jgi:hypothetical protein